jgi:hypothetical protein
MAAALRAIVTGIMLATVFTFVAAMLTARPAFAEKPKVAVDKFATKKAAPKVSRAKACAEFEGKYIAYYSEIFKVEKCKRRPLQDEIHEFDAVRDGKLVDVEADIVVALPLGEPIGGASAKKRSCKELEGRYVTSKFIDVYYVEKCKKRMFPEWDAYIIHSQKRPLEIRAILELTAEEFSGLKDAALMANDQLYDDEIVVETEGLKKLPLAPLCRKFEGKTVAFYGSAYKVEKCKKRAILDQNLMMEATKGGILIELKADEWLSIPKGEPITHKKDLDDEGPDFVEEEVL